MPHTAVRGAVFVRGTAVVRGSVCVGLSGTVCVGQCGWDGVGPGPRGHLCGGCVPAVGSVRGVDPSLLGLRFPLRREPHMLLLHRLLGFCKAAELASFRLSGFVALVLTLAPTPTGSRPPLHPRPQLRAPAGPCSSVSFRSRSYFTRVSKRLHLCLAWSPLLGHPGPFQEQGQGLPSVPCGGGGVTCQGEGSRRDMGCARPSGQRGRPADSSRASPPWAGRAALHPL